MSILLRGLAGGGIVLAMGWASGAFAQAAISVAIITPVLMAMAWKKEQNGRTK